MPMTATWQKPRRVAEGCELPVVEILVLMPVFNGAAFLDAAIASVRSQTYERWRLIVLDAGSTDGSSSIARQHASVDSRITLREEPDEGMYDALRRGLEREAGCSDIMCWLNSDDLYTPWAFAEVAATHARGHDWISGLPALWDQHGRLRAVLPRGSVGRSSILAGRRHDGDLGAIQQESVFFARQLFEDLSMEERDLFAVQSLAGDFHLWRCFAKRAPLHITPSVLAGFRVHSGNRSRHKADVYAAEVSALGGSSAKLGVLRRLHRRIERARAAIAATSAFESAAQQLIADLGDGA